MTLLIAPEPTDLRRLHTGPYTNEALPKAFASRKRSRPVVRAPMSLTFPELLSAYLQAKATLPSALKLRSAASHWLSTLSTVPTRKEVLARHQALCAGHFQPGADKANKELSILRAACRWGLYQECWSGGDPTLGIKKWKTAKRRNIGKTAQLAALMAEFNQPALTIVAIFRRALFGLMLFTGCRPSEARRALLEQITPYGLMGCWQKGKTKTGELQEIPLPVQYMPWLAAWLAVQSDRETPYLFPGEGWHKPLSAWTVFSHWTALCKKLEKRNENGEVIFSLNGLWTYDLRRTLACTLGNELHVDDHTIRAILNHHDGSALGHYYVKSFDSLTDPIQRYADWLGGLKT